jgi:hypothetical protein
VNKPESTLNRHGLGRAVFFFSALVELYANAASCSSPAAYLFEGLGAKSAVTVEFGRGGQIDRACSAEAVRILSNPDPWNLP